MNEMIDKVLNEQKRYFIEKKLYHDKKKIKKDYNDKYSQAFYNLIN